jgi:uncharacterized protein with HEPN domain
MKQPDVRKFLFDIAEACELIESFQSGASLGDYMSSPMLRSAIERQLEIIGEALRCALELDPDLSQAISAHRRIIGLRNRLAHAYSSVRPEVIWGIVQYNVELLHQEVQNLLDSLPEPLDN